MEFSIAILFMKKKLELFLYCLVFIIISISFCLVSSKCVEINIVIIEKNSTAKNISWERMKNNYIISDVLTSTRPHHF